MQPMAFIVLFMQLTLQQNPRSCIIANNSSNAVGVYQISTVFPEDRSHFTANDQQKHQTAMIQDLAQLPILQDKRSVYALLIFHLTTQSDSWY